nr:unnamed protein product [Callosobruchus chinensis]
MLETLLKRTSFVAEDSVTIADFSIVAVVSSSNVLVPVDPNRFPRILEWLRNMQELPYYKEGNQVGLEKFKVVKTKLL